MEPPKKKKKYIKVKDRDVAGCYRIGKDVCALIAEYVAETVDECDALGVTGEQREHVRILGPWTKYKLKRFCMEKRAALVHQFDVFHYGNALSVIHRDLVDINEYPYLFQFYRKSPRHHRFIPTVEEWMIIIQNTRNGGQTDFSLEAW